MSALDSELNWALNICKKRKTKGAIWLPLTKLG